MLRCGGPMRWNERRRRTRPSSFCPQSCRANKKVLHGRSFAMVVWLVCNRYQNVVVGLISPRPAVTRSGECRTSSFLLQNPKLFNRTHFPMVHTIPPLFHWFGIKAVWERWPKLTQRVSNKGNPEQFSILNKYVRQHQNIFCFPHVTWWFLWHWPISDFCARAGKHHMHPMVSGKRSRPA